MTKVLIVESDEGTRYLYQIALKFQRFEVLTATTANEGLQLIQNNKPDLALLDVTVPDLKEVNLLSHLQGNNSDLLPLIILTNLRDGAAKKEAAIYGACEYLNRQENSPGDLINSIRNIIKR